MRNQGKISASLVAFANAPDRHIVSTRYFQAVTWPTGFWFRLFDYGLSVCKRDLLFSERYGYTRYIRVREWVARVLTPKR